MKACIQAAGWTISKEIDVDENVYGEGTVMRQYPAAGEPIDPEGARFELDISTGDPE
ncbi:PASTA domain-containing protein [Streptomyces sp. GC420]|nr:PASTA domain-containing protein [Streptomyces sp. GC420]